MMFVRIEYAYPSGELLCVYTSQAPFKDAEPALSAYVSQDDDGQIVTNTRCIGLVNFPADGTTAADLVRDALAGIDCGDGDKVGAALRSRHAVIACPTYERGLAQAMATGRLHGAARGWLAVVSPDVARRIGARGELSLSAIKAAEALRAKFHPGASRATSIEGVIAQKAQRAHLDAFGATEEAWDERRSQALDAERARRDQMAREHGFWDFKMYSRAHFNARKQAAKGLGTWKVENNKQERAATRAKKRPDNDAAIAAKNHAEVARAASFRPLKEG